MADSHPVGALADPRGRSADAAFRRRMGWLLGLTFLHVFGEGGLALWEAIRTGSLALLAFGLESVIEGGAAFLAVRHLRHLADEEEDHARRDFLLARWIGVSFLLLATYTAARGIYELARGSRAEASPLGLFLTIFATFGMPLVGYFKWKTSHRLGSKGLAAEAKESIACSIDSGLTMLAMIGGLLGAPGWIDPALSLLMVPWFLREGLAHVRGRVHAHLR
jgi:divalent metal cation (Fe/Co/Zn/Cd) transporter